MIKHLITHCIKWPRRLVVVLLALTTPCLAGVPLDRIVAVVEKDIIMESEFNMRLRTVLAQMQQQGITPPPPPTLRRQVLERMALTKIQLQHAERTGIRVDDETLNRTLANIAAGNNVSLSEFREILEQDGVSYVQFRENIRDEIAISRLRQRQVDSRVTITSREIDDALSNREFRGETETEYRLRHILVALPETPLAKQAGLALALANKTLEELRGGQDFAELAAQVSDGQQALEGGDLGWRKRNEVPSMFVAWLATMEKGDVSDVIEDSSGFHIIQLADVRDNEKHMITQTKARHILIKIDTLTTEEDAKTRLEQLRERIEGGDDFGTLARSHSDDMVSAANGGDLGWVKPGQMVGEFEAVMRELEPGQLSEPFATEYGWHLMQVLERGEYDDTENQQREKAADALRRRKSEEAHLNWLRHLRDEAYVEFRLDQS